MFKVLKMQIFGDVPGSQACTLESETQLGHTRLPVRLVGGRKGAGPRPRPLVLGGDGTEAVAWATLGGAGVCGCDCGCGPGLRSELAQLVQREGRVQGG